MGDRVFRDDAAVLWHIFCKVACPDLGSNVITSYSIHYTKLYDPFPMDEVSFDYEVIGPNDNDPDMMDVLLVATRTENVQQP